MTLIDLATLCTFPAAGFPPTLGGTDGPGLTALQDIHRQTRPATHATRLRG